MSETSIEISTVSNGFIIQEHQSSKFKPIILSVFNDVNDMCNWIKERYKAKPELVDIKIDPISPEQVREIAEEINLEIGDND